MNTRRKMEEMLNGGGGQLATAGDAADADDWYTTEEELAQPLLTIYWCAPTSDAAKPAGHAV